jgi:hypothetical protein
MAAQRRLMKELQDIRKAGLKSFRDIQVDEANILLWQGMLVPEAYPFNKGESGEILPVFTRIQHTSILCNNDKIHYKPQKLCKYKI